MVKHGNHHRSHVFYRLFSSSCRFNSTTDVIESSIVIQDSNDIHPTQSKNCITAIQSSSSNSELFSTDGKEQDEVASKVKRISKEDKSDDCFSLSSSSSLPTLQNISDSDHEKGFSRQGKVNIIATELHCSSSPEVSTRSSLNCYDHLEKETKPRIRITLAEQLRDKTFHSQKGEVGHLCSESSAFPRKTKEKEHLCFDSSVHCRTTGKNARERRRETVEADKLWSEKNISNGKTAEIVSSFEASRCPLFIGGSIKESYAVEKKSNDPYEDFMESTVEMILEKKISGAKDIEKLLICSLSLNSSDYHRVILDVFSEICEALFGK